MYLYIEIYILEIIYNIIVNLYCYIIGNIDVNVLFNIYQLVVN